MTASLIVPSIETFIAMDRVFSMETPRESKLASITLEKKRMVEQNRRKTENNLPDLTDFMNDMFFGTVIKKDKTEYNLTGGRLMDEDVDFDDSTRSNSGRLTQEWLQEAKRMVASSPTRCDSPSRLVGSPRFAAAQAARLSSSSTKLDRRDPLSRSARRSGIISLIIACIQLMPYTHKTSYVSSYYDGTTSNKCACGKILLNQR